MTLFLIFCNCPSSSLSTSKRCLLTKNTCVQLTDRTTVDLTMKLKWKRCLIKSFRLEWLLIIWNCVNCIIRPVFILFILFWLLKTFCFIVTLMALDFRVPWCFDQLGIPPGFRSMSLFSVKCIAPLQLFILLRRHWASDMHDRTLRFVNNKLMRADESWQDENKWRN